MADWINDIESRPVVAKALINWPYTTEFEIQGKYLIELIQTSTRLLAKANDTTLLSTAMQCSNILGWIQQCMSWGS